MSLFGHILSGLVETVVDRALTTIAAGFSSLIQADVLVLEPGSKTASKGVSSLKAGRSITAEPALGRFLVRDPIRYDAGTNLYAYCGNNPVNCVDPWGLDDIFLMMVPQTTPQGDQSGTGHNWLEIRNRQGETTFSIGAYIGKGLRSPDPHASDADKREVYSWPLTPNEAPWVTNYYRKLLVQQKQDQWYANPDRKQEYLKPATFFGYNCGVTLDLTKFNVCSTVAIKLVELALRNDEKYPLSRLNLPTTPILQPNNLWNYYHPDDPLPPGEFKFNGMISPP